MLMEFQLHCSAIFISPACIFNPSYLSKYQTNTPFLFFQFQDQGLLSKFIVRIRIPITQNASTLGG